MPGQLIKVRPSGIPGRHRNGSQVKPEAHRVALQNSLWARVHAPFLGGQSIVPS